MILPVGILTKIFGSNLIEFIKNISQRNFIFQRKKH